MRALVVVPKAIDQAPVLIGRWTYHEATKIVSINVFCMGERQSAGSAVTKLC
jgi:hypothetical protein